MKTRSLTWMPFAFFSLLIGCARLDSSSAEVMVSLNSEQDHIRCNVMNYPENRSNLLILCFNTDVEDALCSRYSDKIEEIYFDSGLLSIALPPCVYVRAVDFTSSDGAAPNDIIDVHLGMRMKVGTIFWSFLSGVDVEYRHLAGERKTGWDYLRLLPYVGIISWIYEASRASFGYTGIGDGTRARRDLVDRQMESEEVDSEVVVRFLAPAG